MDILGSVPGELRNMILGSMSNSELCRIMRVSKTWKRACLDPSLWKHLKFVGASRRNLRKGVFNKIISKRAQCKVKSLDLRDVSKLNIDLPTLKATLKALNQLESLSLKGITVPEGGNVDWQAAPPSDTWTRTLFEEAPPSLKVLHIGGLRPVYVPQLHSATLAIPMAQSLEELCLSHVTTVSIGPGLLSSTAWPKLRKLTMLAMSQIESLKINLVRFFTPSLVVQALIVFQERIAQATPSLTDLCIHNLSPFKEESTPSWEGLERLELIIQTLGHNIISTDITMMHSLPRLCPTIRSLEFPDGALMVLRHYHKIAQVYPDIAANYQDPSNIVFNKRVLPPLTELERLEHLYMRDPSLLFARTVDGLESLAWFMDLIKPSMSNGSLTSLAVTFCPEFRFELDRVLNKDAIRTLSCFDFLDEGSGSQCGEAFVHWVQGFHNLTTVGVFPQRSEGCWMHVSKVLAKESRIETIYTDVLTGQARDWVLAKAQEKGVKIIEASRIPEPVLLPRDGVN